MKIFMGLKLSSQKIQKSASTIKAQNSLIFASYLNSTVLIQSIATSAALIAKAANDKKLRQMLSMGYQEMETQTTNDQKQLLSRKMKTLRFLLVITQLSSTITSSNLPGIKI